MALALLGVACTRGDWCWPGDYLINGGLPYNVTTTIPAVQHDSVCTEPSDGGSDGWGWWVDAYLTSICVHGTTQCPCQSTDGSNGLMCICGSSHSSDMHMCYQGVTPCLTCKSGQYRMGCGCGDCRTPTGAGSGGDAWTGVDRVAFYKQWQFAMTAACDTWPYATGFVCGLGTCADCLPGYYCDPLTFHAAPCPAGTYQPQTGQTHCIYCALPNNDASGDGVFLSFDYLKYASSDSKGIETVCDPVHGFANALHPCSKCTMLPANIPDAAHTCPGRDYAWGVWGDGHCKLCIRCNHTYYARPGAADNYCVTDVSKEQCRPQYNANPVALLYRCAETQDAYGVTQVNCANAAQEQATDGVMPWLAGYRRTLTPDAWRYVPGLAGESGLLPYYDPCPSSTSYVAPFRARTDATLLTAREWAYDCDLFTTRECAVGYYAVLASFNDSGVAIVEDCLPCGLWGRSAGGLQDNCTCALGFATPARLAVAQWGGARAVPSAAGAGPQTCLRCAADYLVQQQQAAAFEAFVCDGAANVYRRCTGAWEYVDATVPGACSDCRQGAAWLTSLDDVCADASPQPRAIPTPDRTQCIVCPAGTYIHRGACTRCPPGTYQPSAGQCACLPKRTACDVGQRLERSPAEDDNVLHDAPCVACDLACPNGDMTLFSSAFNSSASQNTCDGADHYFFACFSDPTHGGALPDALAGERVEFPAVTEASLTPPQAQLTLCDRSRLPAYADFVGHTVPAGGVQCYFACLYGVDAHAADAHHAAMRAYAYATRPELIPFLLDHGETPLHAPVPSALKNVPVPTTWLMDGATAALLADATQWLVDDLWTVQGAAAVDVYQNTFLFREEVPPAAGLCRSPSDAFSWPCPTGVLRVPPRAPPPCALYARTQLVEVRSPSVVSHRAYAVMDPSAPQSDVCLTPDTRLWQFRTGCAKACMDARRSQAMVLAANQPLALMSHSVWGDRLATVAYFLQPGYWNDNWHGQLNPYLMPYGVTPAYDTVWVFDVSSSPSTASSPSSTASASSTTSNASTMTTTASPHNASTTTTTASPSNASASATTHTTTPYATAQAMATSTTAATLPQAVQANGTCSTRCAFAYGGLSNTFRYDPATAHTGDGSSAPRNANLLAGIAVCVPCDYPIAASGATVSYGQTVCTNLFQPPRFFLNALCVRPPAGTLEITTDIVCSQCATTLGVATLLAYGSDAYDAWWTVRKAITQFSDGTWEVITCRYSCPAGFTSNNLNADAYAKQPCVPCVRACPSTTTSSDAVFFDEVWGQCGQSDNNFAPYQFGCTSCSAVWNAPTGPPMYLFQAQPTPAASRQDCLMRCNPAAYQGYTADGTFFDGYMPYKQGLQCRSCLTPGARDSTHTCGGGCAEGFYNTSATDCAPCNVSACPRAGDYRPLCRAYASFRDATCTPCLNGSLQNGDAYFAPENAPLLAAAASADLVALARDVRGHTVRRWLSAADRAGSPRAPYVTTVRSPHPEQCAVACINNYAWINLTSGRSPFATGVGNVSDAPELVCLPCAGLARLGKAGTIIYAIWNAQGALTSNASAALASMAALPGGCCACDSPLRDVIATSTQLCELLPGYSDDTLSWQSTFVTVHAPSPDPFGLLSPAAPITVTDANGVTSTLSPPSPNVVSTPLTTAPKPPTLPAAAFDSFGFRRRLLTLAPTDTTRLEATSTVTQSLAVASDAGERTLLAVRMPFFLQGGYPACCDHLETDPETARRCRSSARPPCPLLSTTTTTQHSQRRLLQTQQQQACPVGSVKPERGDAPCGVCPNGGSTVDMGGMHLAACLCQPGWYAVDDTQGTCARCLNGTKRAATDAGCVPCDADKYTPEGDGATECVCLPGTFLNPLLSLTQCVPCDQGAYCSGGVREMCPPHSTSLAGAAGRDECVCEPSYYGNLALADAQCYPRPPGATGPQGGCAANWTARYITLPTGDRYVQCTSPCPAGTYARMAPATQLLLDCQPCDADTYAVAGAQAIDGCTPCPVGRGTRGRRGATSPDDCTCRVGVNANASQCEGCAANHYYDLLTQQCLACPDGQGAPPNTVGFYGCQCLPGTYATGATCTPCPLGSYSHSLSLICTQCPSGCTTDAVGQTTIAACRCARVL